MDNNKKNGNWLTELLEELKLSLVISYLGFSSRVLTRKSMSRKIRTT